MTLDDLELSVRVTNLLARNGVTTIEQFKSLNRKTVRSWKGAGHTTWIEISQTIQGLSGNTDFRRAVLAADNLNSVMDIYAGEKYRLMLSSDCRHIYVVEVLA